MIPASIQAVKTLSDAIRKDNDDHQKAILEAKRKEEEMKRKKQEVDRKQAELDKLNQDHQKMETEWNAIKAKIQALEQQRSHNESALRTMQQELEEAMKSKK